MRVEERSALLKSIAESKTGLSALKHGMVLASEAIGQIRRGQKVPDAELALYESGFAAGGASVDDYVATMEQFRQFVEVAPADVPGDDADVLTPETPDAASAMVALLAQIEVMLAGSRRSLSDASTLMAALASGQTFPRQEYAEKGEAFAALAALAGEAGTELDAVKRVLAGE